MSYTDENIVLLSHFCLVPVSFQQWEWNVAQPETETGGAV